MGGGVALLDSDQDGDLDIYLNQSGSLDGATIQYLNRFFINDGTGIFKETNAGDASANHGYAMGLAVGDIDNNGYPDILITAVRENTLLKNMGKNRFKASKLSPNTTSHHWTTSAAFGDFDLDGDLDLWTVNYIEWSEAIEPECYQVMLGSRDYCSPSHYNAAAQDQVFRNEGDGRFTNITGTAGVLGTKGNGLGIVVTDFNEDGLLDVFVANDSSPNHLWLNQGNFTFEENCRLWDCALDQHGVARAGMGVVTTDLNNDQRQDIVVVNITTQPNYVFYNQGSHFKDVTSRVGLNLTSQRFTRFGLVVEDLDNDGSLDIFEANGAVARLSKPLNGDRFAEPNALYHGSRSGRYTLIQQEWTTLTSRGAAVGDVNNDGLLDIVVVNRDAPVELLMNYSYSDAYWLVFDVRDERGRPAIGAKVSLTAGSTRYTRVVQRSGSYLSSRDPRIHFGLGKEKSVNDIQIRWTNGKTATLDQVETNQIITVQAKDY